MNLVFGFEMKDVIFDSLEKENKEKPIINTKNYYEYNWC